MNGHYDSEMAKIELYREQCSQQIDLALVEQAIKQEEKNEVWRSIQQTIDRQSTTEVVRQYKQLVKKIENAVKEIENDERNVLRLRFCQVPG